MISLDAFFWFMIGFFALIGTLRGWTKEVIASAGLVLSLFVISWYGTDIAGAFTRNISDPEVIERGQFYSLAIIHLVIAFFSYEGPVFAGRRIADRLRVRESLQDKVMGAIVGSVNGYLIIGTLWALLEKRIVQNPEGVMEFLARDVGMQYPFDVIVRPGSFDWVPPSAMIEYLPFPFLEPYIGILLVVAFLFVIVVML